MRSTRDTPVIVVSSTLPFLPVQPECIRGQPCDDALEVEGWRSSIAHGAKLLVRSQHRDSNPSKMRPSCFVVRIEKKLRRFISGATVFFSVATGKAIMETVTQQPIEKPKRVMSEAQLETLKLAREMALKKRREIAAVRAVDREALVLQKISAKHARDDVRAEKEAERRAASDPTTPPSLTVDTPKPPVVVTGASIVAKPKKQAVVVETSDSSEEEGFIDNARVFVVRRERQPRRSPMVSAHAEAEIVTPPPPAKVDPHAALYRSMFG